LNRSEDRDEENVQIAAEAANQLNEIPRNRTMNRKILDFTTHSEYTLGRRTPMPPAVKSRKTAVLPAKAPTARKTKFQADLAPSEDSMVRILKTELQMTSNTDFLTDALALFRWAVSERKRGHHIVSESSTGERKILLFPRLERVAPEVTLPHVDIQWTDKELESLAELASGQPADPTDALIRAMRQ
jgi:hypothetical protein